MKIRPAIFRGFTAATVVFMIGITVAVSGCADPMASDPAVVAIVNGSTIDVTEYKREYSGYLLDTGLQDSPRRRRAFLDRLVGKKLVVAEAYDAGFSDTDAFRLNTRRIEQKLLIDLYLQRTFFDSLQVIEAEMHQMLVRVNTLVKARHLYARSREEADLLRDRLLRGETFDELAKEVFQDPTLRDNGGLLGYFEFDEMDPDFEDAAFGLEAGAISEPVRTALGFSIIQVEDRFVKPIITQTNYAEKKDKLESYVRYRKESRIRRAFLENLSAETAPEFNENTVLALYDFISGRSVSDGIGDDDPLLSRDLVTYREGSQTRRWTIAQFRNVATLASPEARASVKRIDELKMFVSGLVVQESIASRARKAGIDLDPAFIEARSKNVESWLYEKAYTEAVASMKIPDDTVKAYFERFEDEFVLPERVHIREILVSSVEDSRQVENALASSPFSEVAIRFSIRPESENSGGYIGALTREQLGSLARPVFESQENDILGPVEVQGNIAFFHVGPREKSRRAELDEVRSDIEMILRQTKKQAFLRNLVTDLRARYSVEIYPERLDPVQLSSHENS